MNVVTVNSFSEWRKAARKLLTQSISPADARFTEQSSQQQLFMPSPLSSALADARDVKSRDDAAKPSVAPAVKATRVPRQFIELAQKVACHRDPRRFDLLYRVLWRISHDERKLLDIETDDDVHQLMLMEKAVRRDAHKMKAFVRFRRIVAENQEQFIAWHRPDHRIARLVAPSGREDAQSHGPRDRQIEHGLHVAEQRGSLGARRLHVGRAAHSTQ